MLRPHQRSSPNGSTIGIHLLGRAIARQAIHPRRRRRWPAADRGSVSPSMTAADIELRPRAPAAGRSPPLHLRAEGKSYRFVNVDAEVDVRGSVAHSPPSPATRTPCGSGTVLRRRRLRTASRRGRSWWHAGSLARPPTGDGAGRSARARDGGTTGDRRCASADVPVAPTLRSGQVAWGARRSGSTKADRFAAIMTSKHAAARGRARRACRSASALQAIATAERITWIYRRRADTTRVLARAPSPSPVPGWWTAPAALVDDAVVVVRDGRIVAAGARAAVVLPGGAKRMMRAEPRSCLDCGTCTLTPPSWSGGRRTSAWASRRRATWAASAKFLVAVRDARSCPARHRSPRAGGAGSWTVVAPWIPAPPSPYARRGAGRGRSVSRRGVPSDQAVHHARAAGGRPSFAAHSSG